MGSTVRSRSTVSARRRPVKDIAQTKHLVHPDGFKQLQRCLQFCNSFVNVRKNANFHAAAFCAEDTVGQDSHQHTIRNAAVGKKSRKFSRCNLWAHKQNGSGIAATWNRTVQSVSLSVSVFLCQSVSQSVSLSVSLSVSVCVSVCARICPCAGTRTVCLSSCARRECSSCARCGFTVRSYSAGALHGFTVSC